MRNIKNKNELDLRKISSVVLCVKNYKNFKKGRHYNIDGFYGDPQSAIEIGINDYLPVEFINSVIVLTENKKQFEFKINSKNKYMSDYLPYFFEYFEILDYVNSSDKYNI